MLENRITFILPRGFEHIKSQFGNECMINGHCTIVPRAGDFVRFSEDALGDGGCKWLSYPILTEEEREKAGLTLGMSKWEIQDGSIPGVRSG